MAHVLSPGEEHSSVASAKDKSQQIKFQAIWVLIGFLFWFGFYLGAIIMHSITK